MFYFLNSKQQQLRRCIFERWAKVELCSELCTERSGVISLDENSMQKSNFSLFNKLFIENGLLELPPLLKQIFILRVNDSVYILRNSKKKLLLHTS